MARPPSPGGPFGVFAVSEEVASRLELGDHGGTYCGNPLGCAVAYAVINHLIDHNVSANVKDIGENAIRRMFGWRDAYPDIITDVRGKGLLIGLQLCSEETATRIADQCLEKGLFVRQTQGDVIRIFPALNITHEHMEEGLSIIEQSIVESAGVGS